MNKVVAHDEWITALVTPLTWRPRDVMKWTRRKPGCAVTTSTRTDRSGAPVGRYRATPMRFQTSWNCTGSNHSRR